MSRQPEALTFWNEPPCLLCPPWLAGTPCWWSTLRRCRPWPWVPWGRPLLPEGPQGAPVCAL